MVRLAVLATCVLLALLCREATGANVTAAQALVARLLPASVAAKFQFQVIAAVNGMDVFEISAQGGNVTISGNSALSMSTGVGWYLNEFCNCSVQWSGNQLALPAVLPTVQPVLRIVTPMKWRYYLNVCTLSYTMPWWTWDRWQQELDWMALHGINMPLAFTGQEYVFAKVFSALNVTETELEEWFVGPAFLAWGRMGNIRSYGGPLGPDWRQQQMQLQLQILARARDLEMTPVLPAFAGHVPAALMRVFPHANITRSPLWAGFNKEYSAAYLLDANDPLFQVIGKSYIETQTAIFGTNHIYNADTFNEMVPASNETAFLTKTARALYNSLSSGDPEAVWMIQGWMFSFEPNFWQPAQIQAYLAGVPDNNMIILDLDAYDDPQWNRTDSFYGKPFIWCIIDNAGGSTGMYGGLDHVAYGALSDLKAARTMVGTGIAPEGTVWNPITYELFTEMAWAAPDNVADWIVKYVRRRYGPATPQAAYDGWAILYPQLYNTTNAWNDALVSDRPDIGAPSVADWQDCAQVVAAWRLFHQAAPVLGENPGFRFDYVDLTRQVLTNLFEDVLHLVKGAFVNNDMTTFLTLRGELVDLVYDMDAVLATHPTFMLGTWTMGARAMGNTPAEQDLYDYNARHLITIWGPNGELNGYVNRQLAGLFRDFHAPRWTLFLDWLEQCMWSNQEYNQTDFGAACFFTVEKPWAETTGPYPTTPTGDLVDVIDGMFQKYAGNPAVYNALYTTYGNSDGIGSMWDGFLPAMNRDTTTLQYLCTITPSCGGVIHNGWFKPLGTVPVNYTGSTLWVKNNPPAPKCARTACSVPVATAALCEMRCACKWVEKKCISAVRDIPDSPEPLPGQDYRHEKFYREPLWPL